LRCRSAAAGSACSSGVAGGRRASSGGKLPVAKLKEQLQKIATSRTGGSKTDELLGKTGGGPEGLPDSIIVTAEGIEGEVEAAAEVEAPAAEPKKAPKKAPKQARRPRTPRAKKPPARKT